MMCTKSVVVAVVLSLGVAPGGITQGRADSFTSGYRPHLGDLMTTMQIRHLKLWFSGRSKNWPLAAYEINQMMENFQDIASFYPGVPTADMAMLTEPTKELGAAVAAKDVERFSSAFNKLTATCNACHQAVDRGYIVVQVPTASPFSNEVFPPK